MRWIIPIVLLVGCTQPQINIYTGEKQQTTHTDFYPDKTTFHPDMVDTYSYTPDKLAPDNCGTPTEPRECDYGYVDSYPVPKKAR